MELFPIVMTPNRIGFGGHHGGIWPGMPNARSSRAMVALAARSLKPGSAWLASLETGCRSQCRDRLFALQGRAHRNSFLAPDPPMLGGMTLCPRHGDRSPSDFLEDTSPADHPQAPSPSQPDTSLVPTG